MKTAFDTHFDKNCATGKDTDAELTLDDIRNALMRQEETIIFALIERAQFMQNLPIYQPGALLPPPNDESYFDFFMRKTEEVHALMRRYTSPEEHPFTDNVELPVPILPLLNKPPFIMQNSINYNKQIKNIYLEKIVPKICAEGDCKNYGSAAACDILALQAISRRIHYGKFVAEAKFKSETELYTQLIKSKDSEGIMRHLTNEAVERKLLERVRTKTCGYGQDPTQVSTQNYKVDPDFIVKLYKDYLIPITKDVEVEYLLQRLEKSQSNKNSLHKLYFNKILHKLVENFRCGYNTIPLVAFAFKFFIKWF